MQNLATKYCKNIFLNTSIILLKSHSTLGVFLTLIQKIDITAKTFAVYGPINRIFFEALRDCLCIL